MPTKLLSTLLPVLVCPDCRCKLAQHENDLRCPACSGIFSEVEGVRKLWPPSRSARILDSLESFSRPNAGVRQNPVFRALIPPSAKYDPYARARMDRVRAELQSGLIVNLGSKSANWGAHVLNLDLVLPRGHSRETPTVHLLGDIEKLPFADASLDGIICTYVLEHVGDAQACIREIARVVKPGGAAYVTVPFIFPTHPDPLDRWRWTLDGLRYSMRDFEELEAGSDGGPFSAYVAVTPTLLGSAFSNFYLYNAVRFALGWLLFPLKYLDFFASRSTHAHMTAANFYFFGKRR